MNLLSNASSDLNHLICGVKLSLNRVDVSES